MSIWYGAHVADDGELRLCGDLAGKRVLELGVAPTPNCITVALAGAKSIAVDGDSQVIAAVRAAAEQAEVRVECHQQADLADLGFVASASLDVVLAVHSLSGVDDLPRLLRQVHRVLRPGASFVVAMTHPIAAMFGGDQSIRHRYGDNGATFAELYMAFERSNFHLDQLHELLDRRTRDGIAPSVLVLRARKQGV
ncbi:MAG TPA: methyltransferase domain-containing protein [Ilumatobacteraceae bacterium]|nr:methyltransferase domain-containing protein [Ilumatobacteraceae bacterium]HUC31865.1 methyltransferase domain-containing protein [Ilumatobacteraceae bacterium]